LPLEPPYFEKYGLKSVFIGNPICENAPDFSQKSEKNLEFRQKNNISENDILICITPGSRISEVKKIFPEFIGAANLLFEKYPNLKLLIPLIAKTQDLVSQMAIDLKAPYILVEGDSKKSMMFATNFAMAKSGTNALEFSLYKIPLLISYKLNLLSYYMFKAVVKIKFANLINLILNKEVIPELLQYKCNSKEIFKTIDNLILNQDLANLQISQSDIALRTMGLGALENPSRKAAKEILL
jgi:lipid-A-disaccharide synthase